MRKFITFSFDDGITQDRRLVELFNRYGIKCTFNLNSGRLDKVGTIPREGTTVNFSGVSWEEIASLYRGHEVACHSVHHPDLNRLEEEEIVAEVMEDKKALEEASGQEVIGLAYPGGAYDEMVIQTLATRTDIRYARTVVSTGSFEVPRRFLEWHPTCQFLKTDLLDVAEAFDRENADEKDRLLYIWGHSFELDVDPARWEAMERLCQRLTEIKGAEFVTNRQAYEALNA